MSSISVVRQPVPPLAGLEVWACCRLSLKLSYATGGDGGGASVSVLIWTGLVVEQEAVQVSVLPLFTCSPHEPPEPAGTSTVLSVMLYIWLKSFPSQFDHDLETCIVVLKGEVCKNKQRMCCVFLVFVCICMFECL